jgi:hypothetical protein
MPKFLPFFLKIMKINIMISEIMPKIINFTRNDLKFIEKTYSNQKFHKKILNCGQIVH